ncbi:TPA: CesT family type III secretion system chaperone [Citrobacter werkmanii]
MSSRANIILKEYGVAQGVPDMQFNEDGICSFLINEQYDITLIVDNDEKIYFYGVLANATVEEANEKALLLLAVNAYLFSASEIVCCYESQAQALILIKAISLDNVTTSIFEDTIDKIIDTITSIQSTLEDIEA